MRVPAVGSAGPDSATITMTGPSIMSPPDKVG
jgi:hypothetical protein